MIDPNGADLVPVPIEARAWLPAPPNPDLGPDLVGLREDAQALLGHPGFDIAMRAFCTALPNFHAGHFSARTGVVDTVTFAIAVLVIRLDRASPLAPTLACSSKFVGRVGSPARRPRGMRSAHCVASA